MKRRFLTRNPNRDRENDLARMNRLQQTLQQIGLELANERSGFEKRYLSASADAAFSQEIVEDRQDDGTLSARVDDLTTTLINYTRRIAMLDRQIAYLDGMQESLEAFLVESRLAEDDANGLQPD